MKGYFLSITDISLLGKNCSLGYVIRGKEGQTVTSYLESTSVCDTEVPGCDSHITHDGTINSIACGTEPIIVGAYNTANSYKGADGTNYTFQDAFYGYKYGNKAITYTHLRAHETGRKLARCCLLEKKKRSR